MSSARLKPVILCWKKNWILQLSMQNSLPLTNVSQRLSIQKTSFCVSPEHPLADQQTILLHHCLANEPLILFNTDSVQVMTLTRQFKAVGVNPHILLNTSQITTLLNMVKSDRVGTFLYRSIVEAHPDIVGIPVMPSIEQRIGVIWKRVNTRMLRLKK